MRRLAWPEVEEALSRFLVVDVRDPGEFWKGSLPGAVNLPLEAIAQKTYELPRDRPLLVVCRKGQKSSLAGLYLEADGYEVYLLEGGLEAIPEEARKSLSIAL